MKREILKEDKEYFVCYYLRDQKQYLKLRKIKKIATIIALSVLGLTGVLSIFAFDIALVLFTVFGTIAIPTFLGLHYKMMEIIENACIGNITYRVFKKMFKSGELQKLIDEHNRMLEQPVSIGIPKITETSKPKQSEPNPFDFKFVEKSDDNDRTR